MDNNLIEKNDKDLFDRIASDYALKDQVNYCRVARKLRLQSTLRNFEMPIESLLEIGCGCGYTVDYLSNKIKRFVGIDYSKELIKYAKLNNSGKDVNFVCANVNDFQTEEKFSVILMIGVLHHMPEPTKILSNVKQFLTKDGTVIINEPQRGNPLITFFRFLRKRLDKNYSSDQVEFSEQDLIEIFSNSGYKINIYSQGFLTTPLAETTLLPRIIGLPLIYILKTMDQFFEKTIKNKLLRKFSWNIIIEAKSIEK